MAEERVQLNSPFHSGEQTVQERLGVRDIEGWICVAPTLGVGVTVSSRFDVGPPPIRVQPDRSRCCGSFPLPRCHRLAMVTSLDDDNSGFVRGLCTVVIGDL